MFISKYIESGGIYIKQILIIEKYERNYFYLSNLISEINPEVKIYHEKFINCVIEKISGINIDALFISIHSNQQEYIEVAFRIRKIKKYQFTPIIFFAKDTKYELEAFHKVHCYDFLVSPMTKIELIKKFKGIIIDYFGDCEGDQLNKIKLEFKDSKRLVDAKNILYIEYINRRIVIHIMDEMINYKYLSLKQFSCELPKHFIRIHQSFIVNKNNVKEINLSRNVVVMNSREEEIPIGRSYRKSVSKWCEE